MNKFFSGLAVVALLLTPLAITSPAQAVTLKVHREYGQGPVTIPAGVDRVEIVFHGRKGNTVRVGQPCDKATLAGSLGTGGSVAPWRLEAASAWTLLVRPDRLRGQEEDLRPADEDPSPAAGRGRRPRRAGQRSSRAYDGLGHVVVPRHGRVQVRPTSSPKDAPWCSLYLEGAPVLDIANWHAEYERSPQADLPRGRLAGGQRAGRRWPRPPSLSCPRRVSGSSSFPARQRRPRPRHQGPPGARPRSTARPSGWRPSGATRRSACGSPPRATSG